MPGAPPQPWLVAKPGIPEGRVEKHTIKSAIQKIDRPISVYTPASYKADGPPTALLVLFDGEDLPNDSYQVTTLNNLIAAKKIPATVAVFVENVPRRRLVDLVANPEFADFMARELVPWVRSHYNVTKDQKQDSAGRGGDGSKDSTTEGNFLVKDFLASPKLPLRFYLAAGTFEMDKASGGGDILEGARHLRDVLRAKGYEVHYQQFVGGHDGVSWRGLLADGLMVLLGPR